MPSLKIEDEVDQLIKRFCTAIVPLVRAEAVRMVDVAFESIAPLRTSSTTPRPSRREPRQARSATVPKPHRPAPPRQKHAANKLAAKILATIELQHAPGERIERAEIVAVAGAASPAELAAVLKLLVAGGRLVRRGHARGVWYARAEAPAVAPAVPVPVVERETQDAEAPAPTKTDSASALEKPRKPRAKKGPSKASIDNWVAERLPQRLAENAAAVAPA